MSLGTFLRDICHSLANHFNFFKVFMSLKSFLGAFIIFTFYGFSSWSLCEYQLLLLSNCIEQIDGGPLTVGLNTEGRHKPVLQCFCNS